MAEKKMTGGEVDSFCNKCKMTLAHTIIAMVGDRIARVQCNTCRSQHAHKSAPAAASTAKVPRATKSTTSRATAAANKAAAKAAMTFEQLLSSKDATKARRYTPKDTYAVDDVIDHPTFGYGVVTGVRVDKLEVMFKTDTKTLVHGRGANAPAERPTFTYPKPSSQKPPRAEADEEGLPT